jgi:hypothetical protein
VLDETGLVLACGQTDYLVELVGEISVSNQFEDRSVTVVWKAAMCDEDIVFTFRATSSGYEMVGRRPSCAPSEGPGTPLQITFSRPVPASSIRAYLETNPESPSP